ncbi:MAG: methionine adenosyltransferase [Alphaproteobacteria bacterium]|nr:methionine adenosyltransferase [Alphaproteobacteria bacterium]
MSYLFTSESVSCGHPDKICDQISDAILDMHLLKDPNVHTAIETLATTNRVIIAGETLSNTHITKEEIENTIRNLIKNIGYEQDGFDWRTLQIENYLHRQSANIADGIKDFGAGDQGIMFGYAKKESNYDTEYMPLAAYLSNQVLQNLRAANNPDILPDAKSQITVEYDDLGNPQKISKIVLSTQHSAKLSTQEVAEIVKPILWQTIPENLCPQQAELLINPAGKFIIGGPDGDAGLTGRKIVVDTYGGYAPHGGGAFSGKDPSKVDRSAAYMLRWLAKNIVAAGLAKECLLQISYAIGQAEPLSLYINCKNTANVDEQKILNFIRKNIDLTPKGIASALELKKPIYLPTAAYGHFGRRADDDGHFSWERENLVAEFAQC